MADKVEIVVTLSPDGSVHLETRGLKGQSCMAETEALEKSLGTVVSRQRTSEFYQQPVGSKTTVKGR
jgi:hypothetical protein